MSRINRTKRPPNWTKEETLLAFELYYTLPSSQNNRVQNPQIVALAQLLGRTPGSVKLKLQNFKSYDPNYTKIGRVGLAHGSKLDKEICEEFWANSDEVVETVQEIKSKMGVKTAELPTIPLGKDIKISAKQRVGQAFFRRTLLASYGGKCCITGINEPLLLRASHIKPWAKSNDINEKTNPQNGLLLNALHDVAFDSGFITVSTDYKVVISEKLPTVDWSHEFFAQYNGMEICKPNKFVPSREFLEYHNDVIFRR
ncbi:MAG: HNH endonuclease [Firmicutes bacterium]|nr:HNH endonuclease [Bacillota bacterium]